MFRQLSFTLALIGLCTQSSQVAGDVSGFVENFSGTGPFLGFDQSWGFDNFGEALFEEGGLKIAKPEDDGATRIGKLVDGRGSFTSRLEVADLDLGSDLQCTMCLSSFSLLYFLDPQESHSISITFAKVGELGLGNKGWTVTVGSPGERFATEVPESNGLTAIELTYDDEIREYTVSYDSNTEDDVMPMSFGPFAYKGSFGDDGWVQLRYGTGGGPGTMVGGLLDRFSILPDSPTVSGDFNGNGVVDVTDINLLSAAIRSSDHDQTFDLDVDTLVDTADLEIWVQDLANTYFGDANMDGEFASSDLVNVFVAGEYEDDIAGNSYWATGDWNADGDFTSSDIVLAFEDGGYEQGPRAAVVPEPSAFALLLIVMSWCVVRRIPAAKQKNDTEESIPLLPWFEELLTTIEADHRNGWVFNPISLQGKYGRRHSQNRVTCFWAGKVVSRIGQAAGCIVSPADKRTGRPAKFASAHDLRRSCAERMLDAGVPPMVISRVLRHASWETTRRHYAASNVQKDAGFLRDLLTACTSLLFQFVVTPARPAGFEPATYGLEVRCSIQLSYGRRLLDLYKCFTELSSRW